MSKLTRAQLVAALEAAHVSYQRLAVEADALRAEVKALRGAATTKPIQYFPSTQRFAPTQASVIAHEHYTQSLATAREMAMRTGRCVLVGADD